MSWTRNKCQSGFKPVGKPFRNAAGRAFRWGAFIPKELLAKPEAAKVICRVNGSLGA